MKTTSSRYSRRRRNSAMGMVELLTGLSLTVFIGAFVADSFSSTTRMGNVMSVRTTLQSAARASMDRITQDVEASSSVVATYLAKDGNIYSSNMRDTLVLRAPSYDRNGYPLDGHSDTIIYRVVSATKSVEGPYLLQQIVESDGLSARGSSAAKTIAKNVESARFTYLVHQVVVSNGLDLNLGLDAGVFGTGADLVQKVTVGGKPFIIGTSGQANIVTSGLSAALGTLVFVQPPQNNLVIDLLYSVAPWLLPQNVNVAQVMVNLRLSVNHDYLGPSKNSVVDLSSSAVLRNR